MPVLEIPLYKVLYGTLENWTLRYLAAGKTCYYLMAKSYDISTLLYSLSIEIKKDNVLECAQEWTKQQADPLPSETKEEKRNLLLKYGAYLAHLVVHPQEIKPAKDDNALFQEVQLLQEEITQLKKAKLVGSASSDGVKLPGKGSPDTVKPAGKAGAKKKAEAVKSGQLRLPFKSTADPEEHESDQEQDVTSKYKCKGDLILEKSTPQIKKKDIDAWGQKVIPKQAIKSVERSLPPSPRPLPASMESTSLRRSVPPWLGGACS